MLEVYAFMNADEVAAILNGVAALFSAPDFVGLMRVFALLSLLGTVIGVFTGATKMYGLPVYLVVMAIVIVVFTYPRTVAVVDSTNNGSVTVVDNVPMGMAVLISSASHIGLYLTKATEAVFSLPDDLKFQKNGMMFGSRIVSKSRMVAVNNQDLRNDFVLYVRNCYNPDLMDGYKNVDTMRQAPDIWAVMGDTNPARWMAVGGGATPMNCPDAYINIGARWNVEVAKNMDRLGKRVNYKEASTAAANTLLQSQLADGYATMLDIGASAQQIIQQNMLINLYEDADNEVAAQVGNTARLQQAMAKAQAQAAMLAQYATTGKLAEELLPKVRNVIELIIYALFPIVLLMMLLVGVGAFSIVKQYAFGVLWVQMWAPLYAILNFVMTTSMSKQMKATMENGPALTLANIDAIHAITIEQHHIAGMLSMAIPVIAWALVKGAEVGGAAMLGGTFSTAQKSSDMAASSASAGNASLGNVSMNNAAWNNMTWGNNANANLSNNNVAANKFNTDYDVKSGAYTTRDTNGNSTTSYPNAKTVSAASSDVAFMAASVSSSASRSLETQASQEMANAKRDSTAAQSTQAAAFSNIVGTAQTKANSSAYSNATTSQEQRSFSEQHQKVQSVQNSLAEAGGLSQGQSAQLMGKLMAAVSTGTPDLLGMVAGVRASVEASGAASTSFDANKQSQLTAALNKAVGESGSEIRQYANSLANSQEHRNAITSTATDSAGNTAALSTANSLSTSAEASHSQANKLSGSAKAAASLGSTASLDAMKDPYNTPLVKDFLNNKAAVESNASLSDAQKSAKVADLAANFATQLNGGYGNFGGLQPANPGAPGAVPNVSGSGSTAMTPDALKADYTQQAAAVNAQAGDLSAQFKSGAPKVSVSAAKQSDLNNAPASSVAGKTAGKGGKAKSSRGQSSAGAQSGNTAPANSDIPTVEGIKNKNVAMKTKVQGDIDQGTKIIETDSVMNNVLKPMSSVERNVPPPKKP